MKSKSGERSAFVLGVGEAAPFSGGTAAAFAFAAAIRCALQLYHTKPHIKPVAIQKLISIFINSSSADEHLTAELAFHVNCRETASLSILETIRLNKMETKVEEMAARSVSGVQTIKLRRGDGTDHAKHVVFAAPVVVRVDSTGSIISWRKG
jgi:hypothetical protein